MNKDFSNRVRMLRHERRWSQAELAEHVGCAQTTIGGIEAERRGASMTLLVKIANALNVSTDYLLTGRNG